MTLCPKCGYERQPKDDSFVPAGECPNCGIVYDKFADRQRQLDEASQSTHSDKPGKKPLIWGVVLCLLIFFTIKILLKTGDTPRNDAGGNKDTGAAGQLSSPGKTGPAAQNAASSHPQPELVDQIAKGHGSTPSSREYGSELSSAIDRLNKMHERLLSDLYVFHNDIPDYGWDNIRKAQNYGKIRSMLESYRRQHKYMDNDFYVCVDMAVNVWNMLATFGIQSKLMIGNVERDITQENTIIRYLSTMNHAWVLAEVTPSTWIPLETTGGYIVEPSMPGFELYNKGLAFDNPKDFKDCNVSRKAMFETCNETVTMRNNFNQLYAGKPVSAEGMEYIGRMKQKLSDCEQLLGKMTAYLQGR